jgi:hypothetical protein
MGWPTDSSLLGSLTNEEVPRFSDFGHSNSCLVYCKIRLTASALTTFCSSSFSTPRLRFKEERYLSQLAFLGLGFW